MSRDPGALGQAPATGRGHPALAAEIRGIRQRVSPDALSDPQVTAELQELYRQVDAGLDRTRGRHRLPSACDPPGGAPVRDARGYDMRPDPLTARTGAELVAMLRAYRQWADNPSYRKMAARARQNVGHSTMHTALKGGQDDPPALRVVVAIIAGCGGGEEDQQAFATAWRRIMAAQDADQPGT